MNQLSRHIALLTLVLFLFAPAVAAGQSVQETVSAVVGRVVSLVNEGRADPLGMAARAGMDPEQIREELPELEPVFQNGLPPLAHHTHLTDAAQAHVEDMIQRSYYDRNTPEGETPLDRVRAAGYPAYSAGEGLGLLTFRNFMDPQVAAKRMVYTLLRDELRPDRTEPRYILGTEFSDIGVGFGSGQRQMDGRTFNIYTMAVDFCAPISTQISAEAVRPALFQLINQGRATPLQAAGMIGQEAADLLTRHPGDASLLKDGTAPLNRNAALQAAAEAHARELVLDGRVSAISADGRTVQERVYHAGYPADTWVDERIAVVPAEDAASFADVARRLYQDLLRREFGEWDGRGPVLFHPDLREIGIAVASLILFQDGLGYQPVFVAVLDMGSGGAGHQPHIHLTLYFDQDQNGRYNPGEGVPGFGFDVWGYDTAVYPPTEIPQGLLMTDAAGGIEISGFPGLFVLRSNFGRGVERWVVQLSTENTLLPISLGNAAMPH